MPNADGLPFLAARPRTGARAFPFREFPELAELIDRHRALAAEVQRARERIVPWVFHDEGEPLFGADRKPKRSVRRAWRRACEVAGRPGRFLHDFRRTVVRNLERTGVPRAAAMELVGHKTESVYRRYDIVSERDLREAVKGYAARVRVPQRVRSARKPANSRE